MTELSTNAIGFDIRILDLHWLNDIDDATDLCAHGHIYVKIGNEIIADENSFDVTLSSTALYLLRTLSQNYSPGDFASQILPCCGFSIMPDKVNNTILIFGCDNGIDWTIKHIDDTSVMHTSASGAHAIISRKQYREIVLDVADQVEAFYNTSSQKILPKDEYDKLGYLMFWEEWRRLRDREQGT
jgi:hypothetical protein